MAETRKLAAILAADVVGYSRLAGYRRGSYACAAAGAAQRSDRSHHRRTSWPRGQAHRRRRIVEFRSVVDAVRCAIEVQNGMVERNAGLPPSAASSSASASIWAMSSRRAMAI